MAVSKNEAIYHTVLFHCLAEHCGVFRRHVEV